MYGVCKYTLILKKANAESAHCTVDCLTTLYFHLSIIYFFIHLFLHKNIDCGYSLEPLEQTCKIRVIYRKFSNEFYIFKPEHCQCILHIAWVSFCNGQIVNSSGD